ncbi:MAG: hypothetical protein P794_08745 [Epsilonproteobacteria bacterium (ex Lamellibrachia satsuma)]|nr:MAG: hypothetical protein P794_08745 [Epsilonproteobacteria bacterium (ex Lamellibrachia satsuma)]
MRNIVLVLGAMALFTGCASKEEKAFIRSYEKQKPYHKKLQKTEKIQLYDGEDTKALLTATYLFEPGLEKKDERDETFIVGVYLEEETMQTFDRGGFSLTLDGKIPKSIKKLEKNDPQLDDIPFVTEWNQFYFVTFPHVSSKSFKLIFESDLYGRGELHFAKVAKYVLTKKVL